ncbi:hypothetical protein Bbelb_355810 [Branchiostoma belcheri]|nr:hypothetical protein Bbelb_355810 [Branchiostoma belcheri]
MTGRDEDDSSCPPGPSLCHELTPSRLNLLCSPVSFHRARNNCSDDLATNVLNITDMASRKFHTEKGTAANWEYLVLYILRAKRKAKSENSNPSLSRWFTLKDDFPGERSVQVALWLRYSRTSPSYVKPVTSAARAGLRDDEEWSTISRSSCGRKTQKNIHNPTHAISALTSEQAAVWDATLVHRNGYSRAAMHTEKVYLVCRCVDTSRRWKGSAFTQVNPGLVEANIHQLTHATTPTFCQSWRMGDRSAH